MADILIRGMEMPVETIKKIAIYPNGDVEFWNSATQITVLHGAAEALPPHGDLIDRDELLNQGPDYWDEEYIEGDDEYFYRYYLDSTIEDAPVIVPAERSQT